MKKFLLIFGILIVFIVQVVLSYFVMDMLFPGDDPHAGQVAAVEEPAGDHDKKDKKGKADKHTDGSRAGFGATYTLGDMILNPLGATGKRIFKISLALEYDAGNSKLPEELKTREPFIRDFLLEYLGKVPEDSLGDIRNRSSLRDSLLVHVNSFLAEGSINRVLFLDFIRQ